MKYKKTVFLPMYGGGYRKMRTEDIEYLEACSYRCIIHLKDGKTEEVGCTLGVAIRCLDTMQFIRIHRSFAVNVDRVEKYYVGSMVMECGKSLPIGEAYRINIRKALSIISSRH